MGFGDELMVTGHVREMQRKDSRKVRLLYHRRLWNVVFDHNPRIARETDKDVQTYEPRPAGLRPYIARKTDTQWTWKDYSPPVGELYFQKDELAFAAGLEPMDVILEPNMKERASPNKDWGWNRWAELAARLRKAGLRIHQLGPQPTRLLPGARLVETKNFRWAAVALTRARLAILPEGGLHHAAAVVGARAVVIYGGYISPRQTGYAGQVALFTGGEPCGMRVPCRHCARAMDLITPELVEAQALAALAAKAAA